MTEFVNPYTFVPHDPIRYGSRLLGMSGWGPDGTPGF